MATSFAAWSNAAIHSYDCLHVEVMNNVFDSIDVEGFMGPIVALWYTHGDVVVRDNVFSNLQIEDGAALGIFDDYTFNDVDIEGNVFENVISTALGYPQWVCPGMWIQGYNGIIRNNICRSLWGNMAAAIFVSEGGVSQPQGLMLEYNLFEACSTSNLLPWAAAISRNYNGPVVAHYNIFRRNFPRAAARDDLFPSRIADFTLNYWGDPSGPYHPVLNPDGLGDTVGDSVLFDPWLTDSVMNGIHKQPPPLPDRFTLVSYPNPFNPETRIKLTVPEPGRYRLALYNLLGREVREIFDGGVVINREVTLFAGDLPSGVYFARASESTTHRPVATAKLMLLK
jgi:hypothetical protein